MRVKLCLCLLLFFSSAFASDEACDTYIDPADDPKNIIRPCPDYNMDCIRDYFSKNSKCKVVNGTVPDPLHCEGYRMYTPTANITLEFNDVNVSGLNGCVDEFYFNKHTKKLVLAISVPNLGFDSPDVVMIYNRKRKEPIVRRDLVKCVYGPATFTMVFPSICDLNLSQASVFTYVEDCSPRFILGSGLFTTSDPTAQAAFPKFIYSMPTVIQEKFLTQGRNFMNSIIQTTICDFGHKLSK